MMWISDDKIPVAMTIAGSDSGGGAGIEADLKTFAALGVHGTVAITAITAQNTYSVIGIQDVDLDIIEKQIDAVAVDLGINAAKTGMLHTSKIIITVSKKIEEYKFPVVVDPVMIAKSGAPLLKEEAIDTLIKHLIPISTVVTPNAMEAEVISGIEIKSLDDMKKAAVEISKLGPEAVVIKGGHVREVENALDLLYFKGQFEELKAPRINTKTTHGTGCSFSAAITAELAKGKDIPTAIRKAKQFITLAIRFGLSIGKGHGPVNPMAYLYKEASKYETLDDVKVAVNILKSEPKVVYLIPEVGMNVAMATPYTTDVNDIAAVSGRIIKSFKDIRVCGSIEFGASSHLSRYILKANEYKPQIRAAINIKYDENLLKTLESWGLKISYYDRRLEPEDVKRKEGATIPWGVEEAVRKIGEMPDVIYHLGDWGKEPMIVLLGERASKLARVITKLAREVINKNEDI